MDKKIYTVKEKRLVSVVRTHKKWAASKEEAKEMVRREPNKFIEEERTGTMSVEEEQMHVWEDE